MRRARLASLALLLTLFMPLGLAACGGDDDDTGGDGVAPAETDEGAPTDPEAGGGGEGGDNLGGEAAD